MKQFLFGKVFGIGNCVMAIPAIKALSSIGVVDLLIGSTPDDVGAFDVLSPLKGTYVRDIYINSVQLDIKYDCAIMSIPFDGRWRNGIHFYANEVIDARPRPGDPNIISLDSWEKHESEYQMDTARIFGYTGSMPSFSFLNDKLTFKDKDLVYIGMGFKRDANSFWSKKHWGNERFVEFINAVKKLRPQTKFITTGGNIDLPVMVEVSRQTGMQFSVLSLSNSFKTVSMCSSFFGNDTGMAHVAASCEIPTYVMTAFQKSETKNHPSGPKYKCNPFHSEVMDPVSVAKDFINYVWGE